MLLNKPGLKGCVTVTRTDSGPDHRRGPDEEQPDSERRDRDDDADEHQHKTPRDRDIEKSKRAEEERKD
jgi:hypothetical protein